MTADKETQARVFKRQMELAKQLDLPFVDTRDAGRCLPDHQGSRRRSAWRDSFFFWYAGGGSGLYRPGDASPSRES